MQKFAKFLQILLLIFFGLFLIFFIAFETLGGWVGMDEISSDNMVTIMLIGFIIFLASWLFHYLTVSGLASKLEKKELELNKVKAKVYDLEHPQTEEEKVKPVDTKKVGDVEPKNENEKYTED
ncbi:hypothetical protein [Algoriphagus sediminis]|uniref:LapA family protein n=1 Tax=Algoriphagus sediminis TaxID=3057113 RepID=A0ABT7Y9A8_9BACT|nr:hypothetical protein [Algoriphagus sediminis]MDN3203097.1 hypothetical protein [Algoriphagus sediminis]